MPTKGVETPEVVAVSMGRLAAPTLSRAAFDALHPDAAGLSEELRRDLFLTRACLHGDRDALGEFWGRFEVEIRSVGRRTLRPHELDDFVQNVLVLLLVGSGGRPAVAGEFQARGSLRAFVRIVASRRAADLLRGRSVTSSPVANEVAVLHSPTPERQLVTDEVRSALSEVLAEVMADLAPHEKRALRMRYLLGFSVARTARALQLHEGSVSRLVSRLTATISRRTLERVGSLEGTSALGRVALESSIGAWLASQPAPLRTR